MRQKKSRARRVLTTGLSYAIPGALLTLAMHALGWAPAGGWVTVLIVVAVAALIGGWVSSLWRAAGGRGADSEKEPVSK